MDENDFLAERLEANRAHLKAVAYRMLGSLSEADDAVQEAWLHLGSRTPSASAGSILRSSMIDAVDVLLERRGEEGWSVAFCQKLAGGFPVPRPSTEVDEGRRATLCSTAGSGCSKTRTAT